MSPQIVGIGLCTLDHLYLLEDLSALPEGAVLEHSVQGGGPAATAMAAAATLGAACGFIGAVGDDPAGKEILAIFREASVDTSRTLVREHFSSCRVLVLVDARSGDRHFLLFRGDYPRLSVGDIDWGYVRQACVVHFDTFVEGIEPIIENASSGGALISVDAPAESGLLEQWVPVVDVFVGGADRPEWRSDPNRTLEAARQIAARGPSTVILTLGSEGCAGVADGEEFYLPAFSVPVIDTTGTGDVFHGAYLYGITKGWSWRQAALFASAAAAMSARRLGGRAGLPSAAQVAAFLSERGHDGPWHA